MYWFRTGLNIFTGIDEIHITPSQTAKVTGVAEVSLTGLAPDCAITEGGKVYQMAAPDSYDTAKLEAGTVKITNKGTADQKKIGASLSKDSKKLTVSIPKKMKSGVTAYYLFYCNNQPGGYKIFSIATD